MKLYYNSKLKQNSRDLRKNSTLSEVLLWNEIKARKMLGYQFMRQKPIENFIVDFYCSKLMLAIEIDGDSHIGKEEKDKERQREIESLGISFLRFADIEVKKNIEGVLMTIVKFIEEFEMKSKKQNDNPLDKVENDNPQTPFSKGDL